MSVWSRKEAQVTTQLPKLQSHKQNNDCHCFQSPSFGVVCSTARERKSTHMRKKIKRKLVKFKNKKLRLFKLKNKKIFKHKKREASTYPRQC